MINFKFKSALRFAVAFIALFVGAAFSQYTIPSFETGAHTIPPTGNDIIVPFEGTSLKQVSIVPALKPGEVLLRRRFSATEYGLFIGKMNEKVYNKLSAFRPSKSFDLAENVGRKYYSQEVNNPDLDIANLYFDNDLLYVENAARLFYNDGSWSNISAETRLPSRLTVTSTPSGAHVLIDGREKGVTPYNAGAIFSPSVVVQVKMDGYYIQENYVDIPSGQSVKKHWDLSKKITFNDGTSISEEAYTAENTESAEELGERMDTLIIHIKDQKASNVKDLEVFNSTYPKLPGRGEFEEKTDYENRADKYNSEKTAQRKQLVDKGDQVVSRLESALDRVKEYKQRIEARVYTKYFSSSVLKIGKYDADKHVFPAEVAVNEELFKFGISGEITIPTLDAKAFKETQLEGRIKLTYENKLVRLSSSDKKYYALQTLSLSFKDKEYPISGDIVLPDEIRQSKEFKNIQEIKGKKAQIAQQKQDAEDERLRKVEKDRQEQKQMEQQADENRQQRLKREQQEAERQRVQKEFGSIHAQAIVMSILIPGLGNWRVSHGEKSGLFPMLATYSLIGGGIWSLSEYQNNYRNYHTAQTQGDMDKYYEAANTNYNLFGWLFGLGAAVWVWNVIWVANYAPNNSPSGYLNTNADNCRLALQMDYQNGSPGLALKVRF